MGFRALGAVACVGLVPVGDGRLGRGVHQAFILGAGLGTRLRPLTDHVPKPLVPLFHRPLAWWAFEACGKAGIDRFAVNTHHLPEMWDDFARLPDIRDRDVTFFHEPELLETGGGLKNIASWIGDDPLLIHNGDVYSTLDLGKLIAAHEASGNPVTIAIRSEGEAKHIALDVSGTRVTDIRRKLGKEDGTHVFSGIYCVSPEFLGMLPPGEKVSVIPAFLELATAGKLGALVMDDGVWLDLGDRNSYLAAHRTLELGEPIHPDARISPDATVEDSVVGPGAVVEAGAVVRNSVLWAGSRVSSGAELDRCIVCSKRSVSGPHRGEDL